MARVRRHERSERNPASALIIRSSFENEKRHVMLRVFLKMPSSEISSQKNNNNSSLHIDHHIPAQAASQRLHLFVESVSQYCSS
jgi:hypothetical protein